LKGLSGARDGIPWAFFRLAGFFSGGTQASPSFQTLALATICAGNTEAPVGKWCHGNLRQKVQSKCRTLHLDSQQDPRVLFPDLPGGVLGRAAGGSDSETVIGSGVPIERVVPGQQSAATAAKAGAPIHRQLRAQEISP
jgi:hypothetical protein